MRNIGVVFAGVAAGIGWLASANATPQNVVSFGCIFASSCSGGALESQNTTAMTVGNVVSVAGYYTAGDGGGGEFVVLGTQPGVCNIYNATSPTGSVGKTSIAFGSTSATGLVVGEAVSGDGVSTDIHVQPGSEIANITTSLGQQTNITLTLPLTGTVTGSQNINLTISGTNNGTLILDSYGTGAAHNCYQKTNYRGDPHEFGAYGDGALGDPALGTGHAHDDTTYLQNWLGAYGNVNGTLAPSTAPFNFGPWVASIPGSYFVTSPLSCPANATIQGPSNLGNTPFQIIASSGFQGLLRGSNTQAVLSANTFCRLSGVGISGNGQATQLSGNILSSSTTITFATGTDLSHVFVGNVVTGALSTDIPIYTTVQDAPNTQCTPTPCVVVSQKPNVSITSEPLTFWGPDAVDVLGTRVTIDGFSALQNGRYNLDCGDNSNGNLSGLVVKDSILTFSTSDNVHVPNEAGHCANVRLIGDIVNGAGGEGVVFGDDEMTIADGIIEESQGVGLDLTGSNQVSVSAMDLQGNGEGLAQGNTLVQGAGAGIVINNAKAISVCGNHLEGNGGDNAAVSSQIYFAGTSDSVELCGNVYVPQVLGNDAPLRPSFVYDAAPVTILTNTHLHEQPAPQASGAVYSPGSANGAALILPQLQSPRVPANEINGLTLQNDSTATQVDIYPGEAADSTNSVILSNTANAYCPVNLANSGLNGLDTGSVAANTTYFFFLFGSASGGNVSCIASLSLAPNLATSAFNSLYTLSTKGDAIGTTLLYNLDSVAGVLPGQAVQSNSFIQAGTTVQSVGTLTLNAPASSVDKTTSTVTFTGTTTNMGQGMLISDGAASCGSSYAPQNAIPNGDTIFAVGTNTVTLKMAPTKSVGNDCITVSGGNTITLSNAASSTQEGNVTIYTARYRMVGALYTMPTSTAVVPFKQQGNNFYLLTSVSDIQTGIGTCANSIGQAVRLCQLSVPCGRASVTACPTPGLPVEAFGRIVGGTTGDILLSSVYQNAQGPGDFPGPPGYSVKSSTSTTAYPFLLYTGGDGKVRVQASTNSNTAYEVTDGWVLQR